MKSKYLSRNAMSAAAGLLILAAGGGYALRGNAAKPAESAAAPVAVSVAVVLQRLVVEWDDFSGRVAAVDQVDIRPRVSGTIDAVHFQEGQLVSKGAPLFTIDPRPYKAELARAAADVGAAQARLALARTELVRARRLIEERAIAQRELDQRENGMREAEAGLQAAEAARLTASLNLQYTEITAPVSGRVSRAEITVGNLVGAGTSAPLLATVVSAAPVYVNFEVDEPTYARYARNGTAGNSGTAHMQVLAGLGAEEGYPRKGKIKSFDNRVDTGSGTIRARAVFDNADGALTPGMYARVRTGGAPIQAAILIEDKAIGTDQDKNYVMVVGGDNRVSYRALKLGPMVDGLRVVRSGLQKDERIVVEGLQRIHPNDIVTPQLVSMAPKATLLAAAAGR